MSRDVTLREFFLKSNKPMGQIPLLNLHQIKTKVDVRIWSLRRVRSKAWRWTGGTDGVWREPPALTQGVFVDEMSSVRAHAVLWGEELRARMRDLEEGDRCAADPQGNCPHPVCWCGAESCCWDMSHWTPMGKAVCKGFLPWHSSDLASRSKPRAWCSHREGSPQHCLIPFPGRYPPASEGLRPSKVRNKFFPRIFSNAMK